MAHIAPPPTVLVNKWKEKLWSIFFLSNTSKKKSPTASNHSELILLILLRSYHLPKAIKKSSQPFLLEIRATIVCGSSHQDMTWFQSHKKGSKSQFYSIIPPYFSVLLWLWSVTWLWCHFLLDFYWWPSWKGGRAGKEQELAILLWCMEKLFRMRCHHYSPFMFGTRTIWELNSSHLIS